MALFRRSFSRKLPDHLLEISERIYVFDCCLSIDVMNETEYKGYMDKAVGSLQRIHVGASFMVFNFKEGDKTSRLSDILTRYDMTVVDYPCQYEGYPLLPLEMIHYFLRSGESWLSLEGQRNVILMHCDRGGWPVLAFMLAGLLLYRKQYTGEQKTLEMVYRQAPKELPSLLSPINPRPSQLRYLEYITAARRNDDQDHNWPPADAPLVIDCLVLRNLPLFDGGKGCRPVVRIYGQDPLAAMAAGGNNNNNNRGPGLLFSSLMSDDPANSYYSKGECLFVKLDIRHAIQADVFLECIHLHDDLVTEDMMFRVMFHTAFVESNIIWSLGSEEIDASWTAKDKFPKDFKAEAFFSGYYVVPKDKNHNNNDDMSRQALISDEDHESDSEFFEVEDFDSYIPLDSPIRVPSDNSRTNTKALVDHSNNKKVVLEPPSTAACTLISQQEHSNSERSRAETEDPEKQQQEEQSNNLYPAINDGIHIGRDHVDQSDVSVAGNVDAVKVVVEQDYVDHVKAAAYKPDDPSQSAAAPDSAEKNINNTSKQMIRSTAGTAIKQKQSKLKDAVAKVQTQRKVVAKWVPRNKLEPTPDPAKPKAPAYRWVPKEASSSSNSTSVD